MRRILFLLGLLAAAGSIDSLKQALRPNQAGLGPQRRWKDRSREERILLWLCAIVYLATLAACLVCSLGDTLITQKNNYEYVSKSVRAEAGDWKTYALDSDGDRFTPLLHQWYNSNVMRFCCALFGWLLVIRLHFIAVVESSNHTTLESLNKKIASQTDLYRKMKSDASILSMMTFPEIQRLHEEQQRAADVTAILLRNKPNATLKNKALF
jgi:hypothetical protein